MIEVQEKILEQLIQQFGEEDLEQLLRFSQKWLRKNEGATTNAWIEASILETISYIDEQEPYWTFVAGKLLTEKIYRVHQQKFQVQAPYENFNGWLETLVEKELLHPMLVENYSKAERTLLGTIIDPSRDELFTYIGLRTLMDRYVVRDFDNSLAELPQQRWLIIAMTLMINETESRLQKVEEAYWALSNLYMTVATPTLSNAGKTHGQLSSCFIDTVDDSLQSIYDTNTDVATLSKYGGGIGVYMGKVRSRGSEIRGYKGASSGVLPWIKQLNNTAVSVDQLGQRQGAIAVYLDVWHRDILTFLDLRLNNGDERLRAHDIFTGVCLPDIFMEAVEQRTDWHLFDPYEVRKTMGYSLEDFYDEERGAGSFRSRYEECVNNPILSREVIPAIEIMKRIMRSQLETGVPFMFYRDEVNRKNPNKHAGMIYSSNLCSEIAQNMSATQFESQVLDDDTIVTRRKAGDFVVCNLSSINLGRAVPAQVLERLIPIQVRMLDNVIELNTIPVLQADLTNKRYRGIGLGTFGWHHLLALQEIAWESDEAVSFADELYEEIAYLTIQASNALAQEKGAYPLFKGSDWQTGKYFEERGLTSGKWRELAQLVSAGGLRNGYLMAVAPNSSTSILAGSTATIDPIFQKSYSEEKKDYKIP
ncbi:MAG: ribonucleoside-diphosphate reductase subunit alpha, partial [Solibacillus sp.]